MTATDADHVVATRTFYDAIAEDYAALFRDQLAVRPLDRALLAGFAELVGEGGRVADLGCGPGVVTAHLASLGLSVFGLDLSEGMLAIARRENPGLCFEQGSMRHLDLPDGALGGVVSWYSTIHTPQEELPAVYAEFRRVLGDGGGLLFSFPFGDEPLHPIGDSVVEALEGPGQLAAAVSSGASSGADQRPGRGPGGPLGGRGHRRDQLGTLAVHRLDMLVGDLEVVGVGDGPGAGPHDRQAPLGHHDVPVAGRVEAVDDQVAQPADQRQEHSR